MTKKTKTNDRKGHHEKKYENIHRKTGKIEGEEEEENNRTIQHVQSNHHHTSSHHHHHEDTHEKHHHMKHHNNHSGDHKHHDKHKGEPTKQDKRRLKKEQSEHKKQSKQLVSTAETFATSNNTSPAAVVVHEEMQPAETVQQQVPFKINLDTEKKVVSLDERKQNQLLGIKPVKYYKVLGEQRMFHVMPGLIQQRIQEIQQLQKGDIANVSLGCPRQTIPEKEQPIQASDGIDVEGNFNSCSDLFSVDMQNRYFTQAEKQQIICRRCKSSGHFERMCVKDIKCRCFICLGNHSAYACTQRVCFNCNNSGHLNKKCPFMKSTRCARCQKLGHHKADCGAILINASSSVTNGNQLKTFRPIEDEWKKSDDWRIKCMNCGKQGHATCKGYAVEGMRDDYVYGRDFQERMRKYRKQEEIRILKENRKEIFSGAMRKNYRGEGMSEEEDDIQIHVVSKGQEKVKPGKKRNSSNNTKIEREYEKKKQTNKRMMEESDSLSEGEYEQDDSEDISRSDYGSDLLLDEDDSDSYDKNRLIRYKKEEEELDKYRESSSRQRSRSKNQVQHHHNHHHHHENNNSKILSHKQQHQHHNHDTNESSKNHHHHHHDHHHNHDDHTKHTHKHSGNSSKIQQNSRSHTRHNSHKNVPHASSNFSHDRYFSMDKEQLNLKNNHEGPRSRRKNKQ